MSKKLPPAAGKSAGPGEGQVGNQTLNVDNYHYHGNDLAEIAKIAEKNPQIAEKIIDHSSAADKRANTSYRFGVVSSLVLAALLLGAVCFLAVSKGLFVTLAGIGLVLAVALAIRVILTGEWSDTTWAGRIVGGIAKALGGSPKSEED